LHQLHKNNLPVATRELTDDIPLYISIPRRNCSHPATSSVLYYTSHRLYRRANWWPPPYSIPEEATVNQQW